LHWINRKRIGPKTKNTCIEVHKHWDSAWLHTQQEKVAGRRNMYSKSAITDHVRQHNHVIDWEQAVPTGQEDDRDRRWIKEAIWWMIRRRAPTMNRNEGEYQVLDMWSGLLTTAPSSGQ